MEKTEKFSTKKKESFWKQLLNNLTENKKRGDFWIIISTMLLLTIGIVMVSSASSYTSIARYGKQDIFLLQQLKAAIVGIVLLFVAANFKYEWIKKVSYIAFIGTFLAMLLVFVPGLGHASKGATRWIMIGSTSLQPSEFMKIGLIMGLARYISDNFKKIDNKILGIFPIIAASGAICVILYFQNHMSATLIMLGIAGSMVLASGVRIKKRYWIILFAILAIGLGAFIVTGNSFRFQRIASFLNPEDDSQGVQWQANQSLYAVGSGKLFGRGLGQSRQKYLWLPEAQTDFIFSVYAEEFGFAGCILVLICFLILFIRGYRVAINNRDLYASLLSIGIVTLLAAQVVVNLLVVTASCPVVGMPLPLLSHGGTALMINLGMIGLLLNMSKRAE